MQAKTRITSPLGAMTLLADEQGLLGVWFDGQQYFGGQFDLAAAADTQTPILRQATHWLQRYFAVGPQPLGDLSLHLTGTPYRQHVMQALCQVPAGQVATYQQLADQISQQQGHPTAARAIGGAVGHNPLSVIVPCHRIVGQTGALVGYAGGLERKAWLLKHEGLAVTEDAMRLAGF
ncbi:methylated-DNA--[protein]-cysteine S-methyltransferase [Lacticaseibacillus suibinensis]|uniref:methylated-DNA--[protein]-cysteine S-methyltransferase n=1 Tax=Lacticaseibacillus suibinensis TaxID=2486011 RepID=UPI000F79F917|nr:methylated-DNA--[protein]-cysteine S-methyltransferase [Lacticaseibacillus suibinensis]